MKATAKARKVKLGTGKKQPSGPKNTRTYNEAADDVDKDS
jgi:hypothetical protein